ncbi:transcription elongation factor GreA [Eubacteriales bacterium OttesenSCG-928-N13]|nr:transcription elongation factor GreA [Eubacteriales bacterium OttesenSCG-928-N13]
MTDEKNTNRVVLTSDGKRKLEEELNELKVVRRVEVAQDIKTALSFGDLSENAEYDEAKNAQARLEGRVRDIEDILRNAVIVNEDELPTDIVGVGSVVTVYDMDYKETDTYTLVGATEADPKQLRVSTESPIGVALMGAKAGDVVEAQTPGGALHLRVEKITRKK